MHLLISTKQQLAMNIKILFIDDHPLQVEGCKAALQSNPYGYEVTFDAAYDLKSAYKIVNDEKKVSEYNIIFVDKRMQAVPELKLEDGTDLIEIIQKKSIDTKIAVLTTHTEYLILFQLTKKYDLNALLVKSDSNAVMLATAVHEMMQGRQYFSRTAVECMKDMAEREHVLDYYNRRIIFYLSQGIRTKNLAELMNLSQSTIEKRKAQIRDYLCIKKGGDPELVAESRRLGLV